MDLDFEFVLFVLMHGYQSLRSLERMHAAGNLGIAYDQAEEGFPKTAHQTCGAGTGAWCSQGEAKWENAEQCSNFRFA